MRESAAELLLSSGRHSRKGNDTHPTAINLSDEADEVGQGFLKHTTYIYQRSKPVWLGYLHSFLLANKNYPEDV